MNVSPFTNVKVSIYNDNATTFSLSWEHAGARYHVWIDRHNYTIEADPSSRRPTLYMNPSPNVLRSMDGCFRTRKLDACKHSIVDAVLAHAKRAGLIEATPRCPRCKLRQSRPASACPSNADNRCTCCDLCRRECALDAKGSLLKRS
jgi:hypothetical protein